MEAEGLEVDGGRDGAGEAAGIDLGEEGVGRVEEGQLHERVENDVVGEGGEVQASEVQAREEEHGKLGAASDGVANDEGFIEPSELRVAVLGAEELELVEDDGGKVGTGEEVEDGVVGDAGVATGGAAAALSADLVKELEAEEEEVVLVVEERGGGGGVGVVMEDAEDEDLGVGEVEGGESGSEGVVIWGGGEGGVDAVQEREWGGATGEPFFEGVGDLGSLLIELRYWAMG